MGEVRPHPIFFEYKKVILKRKKDHSQETANLLILVPKHQLKWQENSDGKVELLKPKFSNERVQHIFSKLMKQTHFKIKLDGLGSTVWKLIDGKKTVEEIGIELQRQFSDEVEPVYERLGQFIGQLHRSKFISIHNL